MNKEELIQAVRYYEGDVSGSDPLLSDTKAYVTLNALFFPGTENEEIKVRENRFLNPAFISRKTEVLTIIHNLFMAIHDNPCPKDIITYRVERLYDFNLLYKERRAISFTSTSKNGFLNAYGDKEGIVLMRFHIPQGLPCLDMGIFLPSYAKVDEAEILLPPFLQLILVECEMSEQEKQIKDRHGNSPAGMYDIWITGYSVPSIKNCPGNNDLQAMAFLNALNKKKPVLPEERQAYLTFKQHMLHHIIQDFQCQFLP